eukprot:13866973-Alexandrium_andersonii.AAC.1
MICDTIATPKPMPAPQQQKLRRPITPPRRRPVTSQELPVGPAIADHPMQPKQLQPLQPCPPKGPPPSHLLAKPKVEVIGEVIGKKVKRTKISRGTQTDPFDPELQLALQDSSQQLPLERPDQDAAAKPCEQEQQES